MKQNFEAENAIFHRYFSRQRSGEFHLDYNNNNYNNINCSADLLQICKYSIANGYSDIYLNSGSQLFLEINVWHENDII